MPLIVGPATDPRNPLRDRQPGHIHLVLLVVEMLAGDELFLARRPVNARPVLAQPEPADRGGVRAW
jgi:hypothetical protein